MARSAARTAPYPAVATPLPAHRRPHHTTMTLRAAERQAVVKRLFSGITRPSAIPGPCRWPTVRFRSDPSEAGGCTSDQAAVRGSVVTRAARRLPTGEPMKGVVPERAPAAAAADATPPTGHVRRVTGPQTGHGRAVCRSGRGLRLGGAERNGAGSSVTSAGDRLVVAQTAICRGNCRNGTGNCPWHSCSSVLFVPS